MLHDDGSTCYVEAKLMHIWVESLYNWKPVLGDKITWI